MVGQISTLLPILHQKQHVKMVGQISTLLPVLHQKQHVKMVGQVELSYPVIQYTLVTPHLPTLIDQSHATMTQGL